MPTEQALKVQFTTQLRKSPTKGGWSYVMAMGGGVHKLPVKAEIFKLLGKKTGDVVTVRLTARDPK
jgi:hypothetical protein